MPRKARYWKEPDKWRAETKAWSVRQPPAYQVWANMIARCHNPRNKDYRRYGGRGIIVCRRWRESFATFLLDMGSRPSHRHTLDRRNNDGDYNAANCRWRVRKVQSRNMSTNRILKLRGRSQCVSAWAEERGINRATIYTRLSRGWSDARALS